MSSRFFVFHFSLILSLCLPMSHTLADEGYKSLLFRAGAAAGDGLLQVAEELALQALAKEETEAEGWSEAFGVYADAVIRQGKAERLLTKPKEGADDTLAQATSIARSPGGAYWRGRALLSLGKGREAVEVFTNALPQAGTQATTAIKLILPEAYLTVGETNLALAAFGELRAFDLPADEKALVGLDEARLLHSLSRQEEAESLLIDLLDEKSQPRSPISERLRLQLAEWRIARGDNDGAQPLIDELIASATDADVRGMAYLARARRLAAEDRAEAALEAVSAAIEAAEGLDVKWAANAALFDLHIKSGGLAKAGETLAALVSIQPRHPGGALLGLRYADALRKDERATEALHVYRSILAGVAEAAVERRAQLGRAECLVSIGRLAEAAIAYQRLSEMSGKGEEAEAALFRAGELLREASLHAQASETLARFRAEYPESALASRAALLQGLSLAETAPGAAEEHFLDLAARYPDSAEAPRALFQAARAAAERDVPTQAVERYAAAASHPSADSGLRASALVGAGLLHLRQFRFERALEELDKAAGIEGAAGEQAGYLRVIALYNMGREQAAVEACSAFIKSFSHSPWAPDANYWMARYYFNHREFEEAGRLFAAFLENWPARPECDGALLWLARSLFERRDWQEASAAALQLVRDYPESPLLAAARMLHGESLCERMRFDEAILAFDELLALYPNSPWAAQALGRKGDSLFTLGTDNVSRYAESVAAYEEMLAYPNLAPDMQLQAAYKIGRCHEKAGDIEMALEQYYTGVILRYAEARESGAWLSERAGAWFARAALSASDLYEQREEWAVAIAILRRLAAENVPGRNEARERAQRLQRDHPGAAQ